MHLKTLNNKLTFYIPLNFDWKTILYYFKSFEIKAN